MSILAAERQQHILARLGREGRVLASVLAEVFSTSEDTIRRDLRELAGRGLCRRVYGGALPVSPASNSVQLRAGEAVNRKAALGRALAALVAPGSLVFVELRLDQSRGGGGFSRRHSVDCSHTRPGYRYGPVGEA